MQRGGRQVRQRGSSLCCDLLSGCDLVVRSTTEGCPALTLLQQRICACFDEDAGLVCRHTSIVQERFQAGLHRSRSRVHRDGLAEAETGVPGVFVSEASLRLLLLPRSTHGVLV